MSLLSYLKECFDEAELAESEAVRQHLAKLTEPLGSVKDEDGYTALHLLLMAGARSDAEGEACCRYLLAAPGGEAACTREDLEGEIPLDAALSIADEEADDERREAAESKAKNRDPEDDTVFEEEKAERKAKNGTRAAMLGVLVTTDAQPLEVARVERLIAWARRDLAEEPRDKLLALAKARVGDTVVESAVASEELLDYLQECAYDGKSPVRAESVAGFLGRGARPSYQQKSGVTPVLMIGLNPYFDFPTVQEVLKLLIAADPAAVEHRDAFKLTAVDWAADYVNIARQHNLKVANPGVLIALHELLPPGLDSGLACVKTATMRHGRPYPAASGLVKRALRFQEGDRVRCRVAAPGGVLLWEEATVIATWLREAWWPREHPGAAYEAVLDIGGSVLAIADRDDLIQSLTVPLAPAGPQRGQKGKPKAASRFTKRQREDGKWEMVDSVTGRTRPIATPDGSEA